MPRIRSIKYEFYMNEDLASVSLAARLLFIGLWTIADKAGRLEDRPIRIKAQLFPYEDLDVDPLLNELSPLFLQRYTVDSKAYIQVVNFQKHQKPHPKETESILPEPGKAVKVQGKTRTRREKDGTSKVVSCTSVNGISVSGISVNGNGDKSIVAPATPDATSEAEFISQSRTAQAVNIFNYWKQERGRNKQTIFDNKRKRAVEDRLKAGYTVEFIKQAIRGIKQSPHHMGDNSQKQVYDDLELICRDSKNIETFAALDVGNIPARASPRSVCEQCHGQGVLMVYDAKIDSDVETSCFMCHGEKVKAS